LLETPAQTGDPSGSLSRPAMASERSPLGPAISSSEAVLRTAASPSPRMSSDPTEDHQKHLLLLCDYHPSSAGTIVEHILAFQRYSRHRVWVLSRLGDLPPGLDLSRFDGIILHYSLVISYDSFLGKSARAAIRRFKGFKAVFIQDDYRWVNRTVSAMQYLRVNAIFCLAPQNVVDFVYSPKVLPGVRKLTVLAGYVPEQLTSIAPKPYSMRSVDIGYRARKLPAWIGAHAQEKWLIADRFLQDAPRYGLRCDVSYREEDRIYGEHWIEFLRDCRAVLGSESGSSVCDFTGEIQERVEAHERRDPNVSFEVLREFYFKDADGRVMMNIISPRCFEAAALRSLMILYEGNYSGVLVPWRHYVPLRKDHSNMDEVVAVLRDQDRWAEIVECAYREIALNPRYTFRSMVEEFDEVADQVTAGMPRRLVPSYDEAGFRTASTILGVASRGWRIAVGELGAAFERSLQSSLVRLIAPIKDRRVRGFLKRAYFAVVGAFERSIAITCEVWALLRATRDANASGTLELLSRLRLPLSKKLALLRELRSLLSLESLALEHDAFRLRVWADFAEGVLRVEAMVSGDSGASLDEPSGWTRVSEGVSCGKICSVRWRIQDAWGLAPRPGIPDEYEFPVLSEVLGTQPALVLPLIQQALPRLATSAGGHTSTETTFHAT